MAVVAEKQIWTVVRVSQAVKEIVETEAGQHLLHL
jgi:hypothetical protein